MGYAGPGGFKNAKSLKSPLVPRSENCVYKRKKKKSGKKIDA